VRLVGYLIRNLVTYLLIHVVRYYPHRTILLSLRTPDEDVLNFIFE